MIKLSKQRKSKRVEKWGIDENQFFVFDTETNGLSPRPSKFIFGCVYGKNYKKVIRTVEDFKKEFKKEMYHKKYIFAHNLEYDLPTIYGNVITNIDNGAIYNGSKLICCSPDKENKVLFCDSTNILLGSVKSIGHSLGIEKLDIEKAYLTGRTKNIRVTKRMVEYCFRDCEIIFKALERFFNLIGKIKITIASSALHYFLQNYLKEDLFYNKQLCDEFFKSYYGGRTEVFKFGINLKLNVFDINSLYPYIMKNIILPHPAYLKEIKNIYVEHFEKLILFNYEGMAEIEVQTPLNNYFGFLPFKEKKETSLNFPNGKFITTVNLNELRFAVEKGNYKILKVNKVIYSTKVLKGFFTEFIEDLYFKRINSNDEFEKMCYKLLMNSAYGKFGQRELKESHYFTNVKFAIQHLKEFEIKKYEFKYFNSERKDLIVEYSNNKIIKHSIPLIASYITSGARVEILKNLIHYEKEIYYCDTDSLFLHENANLKYLQIGCELGQFKKENKIVTQIRGLKNYEYIDLNSNKLERKIKGVSKKARFYKITQEYKLKKYYKSKQSLRNQKETGSNYIMKKKLSLNYDKRIILNNLDTKPIIL